MVKKLFLSKGLLNSFILLITTYSLTIAQTSYLQVLFEKYGAATEDRFGYSVALVGDLDGDGKSDFIIGAPTVDTGGVADVGAAYVYSGANGALLYQKTGVEANDQFAISVAGTGDLNGDGRADFILGAYLADPFNRSNAGSAFVYSGFNGSLIYQKDGAFNGDRLGGSVAAAGDVNADGRDDFIIGAERANPAGRIDAGSAFVYSGRDSSLLYRKDGATAGDEQGFSVAGAGDLNGDGKADFIVGAPLASPSGLANAGSAYVYSGSDGALLYQKDGAGSSNYMGNSVAGAGDLNGDGRPDFIVGAPGASPGGLAAAGSAYIYSGADGALLYQKGGAAIGDGLGTYGSIAGAGDVNGDGGTDFIIGAFFANPGGRIDAGSALLFSGMDGSLLFQVDGDSIGDNVGSVGGAEDINGDGKADIIVGAPGADPGGLNSAGSGYVYGLVATDVQALKNSWPVRFELSQNYPNPFNPSTTIRYFLAKREKVPLEIFNLLGERVKALLNGEKSAGEHAVSWDGTDEKGKTLPSGIYFYRLKAKDHSETKKMHFLK